MDFDKGFDSLDHDSLSSVLRKFGFGKNFITWVETLSKDQLLFYSGINGSEQLPNILT